MYNYFQKSDKKYEQPLDVVSFVPVTTKDESSVNAICVNTMTGAVQVTRVENLKARKA